MVVAAGRYPEAGATAKPLTDLELAVREAEAQSLTRDGVTTKSIGHHAMWVHAQRGRLTHVSGLMYKAATRSVGRITRPRQPGAWKWQPRLVVACLAHEPPTLQYQPSRTPVVPWPREPWLHATKTMATLVVADSGAPAAARRVDQRECGGFKEGKRLQVWSEADGSSSGRWVDLHTSDAAECTAWLEVLLKLSSSAVARGAP